MKLIALQDITGKTKTIEKGSIFEIPDSKAVELVQAGVAAYLIKQVAYKIYSNVLGCYLWITDCKTFNGGEHAVYSSQELLHLLMAKPEKEALWLIHQVKLDFHGKIAGVSLKGREKQ